MEAAGLASSIITFIDFSYKLILGTVDVHKKAATGLAADPHISNIINDLENVTRNMKTLSTGPSAQSLSTPQNLSALQDSSHHEALRKLALGCNELSKSLVNVLKDLERKPGGNKLWRSFQTSWATLRSSEKIIEMEQKLNTYRLQLLVRLSMMVAEDAASAKTQMDQMRQGNETSFSETITELRSLRDDMKKLDGNLRTQASQSCQVPAASPDQVNALTDVREELSRITRALDTMRRQSPADLQILSRLRFSHVYSRYDAITRGEFGSFARLLREGSTAAEIQNPALLIEAAKDARLQEQKARKAIDCWINLGGSVLHISGKPGSGKSTLMKLLGHDELMGNKLRTWAADSKLVTARFFFWLSGDTLQNSLQGLYRSLLLEVLQQCPELTRHVFSRQWHEISTREEPPTAFPVPFRLFELQDAMSKLVYDFSGGVYRFCFFIDGLDEYAGDSVDHVNLARQLRQWAKSTHIKICASSRPYQEFHSVFDQSTRIDLHELTGPDILSYSQQVLEVESQNHICPYHIKILANEIKTRASGVFLWALLVVRSICEGILHLDTYDSLLARLDEAPNDLMQLFLYLFNKINPIDRTRAYQLLLLVSSTEGPRDLNAISISWIKDLEDIDFPYNKPRAPLRDDEVARRIRYADGQLKLTCRGLLELRRSSRPSNDVYFQRTIGFLHRTVVDFLHQPETLSAMQQHLGERNLTSSDHVRLAIAEFKFARLHLQSSKPGALDNSLFWCYYETCQKARGTPRALEECEKILYQLRQESPSFESTLEQAPTWETRYIRTPSGNVALASFEPGPISHVHLLLYFGAPPEFVLGRIKAGAHDSSSSDLCLISSAIWTGYDSKYELSHLRLLLGHGFDLRERLSLFYTPERTDRCHFPGWVAFLILLGNESCMLSLIRNTRNGRLMTQYFFAALELLLCRRTRPELDIRMEFYVYDNTLSAWAKNLPERSITLTLEELIIRMTPPNTDTLLGEIGARKTWGGWASWTLKGVTALPWPRGEASMQTAATGLELLQEAFRDAPLPEEYLFGVRKIWVGGDAYDVPGLLSLRLF